MQSIPVSFSKYINHPSSSTETALFKLSSVLNNITLYFAGLPDYPWNFARDSMLSAILMEDTEMLHDQLVFCSLLQGTKKDPFTGEEPGKIFHQMPGVIQNKLSTEYNACDTTALFIYGHEVYLNLTSDYEFISRQKKYIEKATDYILRHLVNYLFVEDPKFSDAKRFALKLTYWKDSQVSNRKNGSPFYPAVFTLAHVQNMRALRSASKLIDSSDLLEIAEEMKRHLTILFDEKHGVFYTGVDQKGFFPGVSSDNLHMLYYLEPGDLSKDRIQKIIENTKRLETVFGYITLDTKDEWLTGDVTKHTGYHTNTVWPFEQAMIHSGASKFGIESVKKISERIYPHIENSFPELFINEDGQFRKKGSEVQLWTIASKIYFDKYFSTFQVA